MRIPILLAASAAAALALHAAWSEPAPAQVSAEAAPARQSPAAPPVPAASGPLDSRPEAAARRTEAAAALAADGPPMLRAARLQDWWRAGQARCKALGIEDCRRWLLAAIDAWPDARAKAIAARAIERLPAATAAQSRLVQDMATPLSQRLQRLSALREATMGREEAQAWFGREKAQTGFTAAVNEFAVGQAAAMPLASRMAQVESLRATHYGALYADLRAAEGAVTQYRIELGLAMLDVPDAAAAAGLRQRLRARYFPGEQAQQIALLESRAEHQEAQRRGYALELSALQQQYRDGENADHLARLGRLQQKYFQ